MSPSRLAKTGAAGEAVPAPGQHFTQLTLTARSIWDGVSDTRKKTVARGECRDSPVIRELRGCTAAASALPTDFCTGRLLLLRLLFARLDESARPRWTKTKVHAAAAAARAATCAAGIAACECCPVASGDVPALFHRVVSFLEPDLILRRDSRQNLHWKIATRQTDATGGSARR